MSDAIVARNAQRAETTPPATTRAVDDSGRHWIEPMLLAVWVVANYGSTCWGGFINDDFIWLDGAWIGDRPSWWHAALLPHPWYSRHFVRPVIQLSFFLNYQLGGLNPFGYHAVNIALHALNVVLVWRLASDLFGSSRLGCWAALLFGTQPYNAFAVAWVSGRTQLLGTMFLLLALWLHQRGKAVHAGLAFVAALLANELAICFPPLVLLLDVCRGKRGPPVVRQAVRYAALVLPYLVLRSFFTQQFAHGVVGLDPTQPLSPAAVAELLRGKVTLLGQYLLAPLPVYGFLRSIGALLAVGIGAAALARLRSELRSNVVASGLGWVLVTLLPFALWYQFNPWYVYLPSVGLSMLCVAAGSRLAAALGPRRHGGRVAFVLGVLCLCASIIELQAHNRNIERAGLASVALLQRLTAAVSAPAPRTMLCLGGLGPLRLGLVPATGLPIFVFGLPEAAHLWFHDPTLRLRFAETAAECPSMANVPALMFTWDAAQQAFQPGIREHR